MNGICADNVIKIKKTKFENRERDMCGVLDFTLKPVNLFIQNKAYTEMMRCNGNETNDTN